MDIAELGVVIDPSGAQRGAEQAKTAAADMAQGMTRSAETVVQSSRQMGEAVQQTANSVEQSSRRTGNALDNVNRRGRMSDVVADLQRTRLGVLSSILDIGQGFGLLPGFVGEALRGVLNSMRQFDQIETRLERFNRLQNQITASASRPPPLPALPPPLPIATGVSNEAVAASAVEAATAERSVGVAGEQATAALIEGNAAAIASNQALAASAVEAAAAQRVASSVPPPLPSIGGAGRAVEIGASDAASVAQLDAGLTNLAASAGGATNALGALVGGGGAGGGGGGIAGVGAAAGGAVPPITGATTALGGMGGAAGGVGPPVAAAGAGVVAFGLTLTGLIVVIGAIIVALGALVLAYEAVTTAAHLVAEGIELAGPMERARIGFETITGSARETRETLEALRDQSEKTGTSFDANVAMVQKFTGLGMPTQEATKLNASIMDIGASLGKTDAQSRRLGDALASAFAKGTVTVGQLTRQIGGQGIPVITELANKLGVSTGKVIEMAKAGELSSKTLIDLFKNMDGSFKNMEGGAQRMTATFPGAVSRITEIWHGLLRDIGGPVGNALAPILNKISDMLISMKPYAKAIGEALADGITFAFHVIQNGEVWTAFKLGGLAALEWLASFLLTSFITAITAVGTFLLNALVSAVTLPVTLFFSLLSSVIDFITALITGNWSDAIASVMARFLSGGTGVVSYIGIAIINAFGNAFQTVINAFYVGMMKVVNSIQSALAGMLNPALGALHLPTIAAGGGDVAPLKIFTPIPQGDLGASVDNLVGHGNRDAFSDFFKQQLGPTDRKDPADHVVPKDPIPNEDEGDDGKGKKEKKPPKAKLVKEGEFEKLIAEWENTGKQIDKLAKGIADSIANHMTDAIMGLIDGTKTAKQAFTEMATGILNDITKMIIKMEIQKALAASIGGSKGSLVTTISEAYVASAHSGGEVGSTNMRVAKISSLRSFHSGGGLASSEEVVKTEKGETILTKRQSSQIRADLDAARGRRATPQSQGANVQIVNVLDPNQAADAINRNPNVVVNAMSKQLPRVRKMVQSGRRS